MGIDVVGKGEEILRIAVVVLKGDVDINSLLLSLQVNGFG
jgi:hypothetical protein